MTRPVRPEPRRAADNPFASHRIESLPYRCCGTDPEALARRLDSIGGRAVIVGPKGAGKTTLLEAMAARAGGHAVLARVPGGSPGPWRALRRQLPASIEHRHRLFLDGCEQLGTLGWHRLLHHARRARSLVATSHRPGRLPTLTTCAPSLPLLRELVAELVANDERALDIDLGELFERHGGDIRRCVRELYDAHAGRIRPSKTPFRRSPV